MTTANDATEFRGNARETRASLAVQAHFLQMVRRVSHAMLLTDAHGRIVASNPRAEALLDRGRDALQGALLASLVAAQDRAAVEARLHACLRADGEAPEDLEVTLDHGYEGRGLMALTFLPLDGHVGVLLRDMTRERERRDHAQDDRKMADLGRIVSVVAHEMRTPLTYVMNSVALSRAQLARVSEQRPELEPLIGPVMDHQRNAERGAHRIQRLLRDLRPLTKNRPHRATRMDLAELVVEAVQLFRGTHAIETRIELDLEATHLIPVDREDMVGVVLNLLENAAEAMRGKGVVRVVTRNRERPPEIRVIDSGPGLAPEMRSRLFEPFQTTKLDGTGLGLFISRRTVEAHGGTLTVEDNPEGGATFVLRLPFPDEG